MLGRPYNGGSLKQTYEHLNALVQEHLRTKKAREVPFPEALARLEEHAGENEDLRRAVKVLSEFNQEGALNNVPFDSVWNMINAVAKSAGYRLGMSEFDVVLEARYQKLSRRRARRHRFQCRVESTANLSPCSALRAAARPRRCA